MALWYLLMGFFMGSFRMSRLLAYWQGTFISGFSTWCDFFSLCVIGKVSSKWTHLRFGKWLCDQCSDQTTDHLAESTLGLLCTVLDGMQSSDLHDGSSSSVSGCNGWCYTCSYWQGNARVNAYIMCLSSPVADRVLIVNTVWSSH